MLVRHRYPFVLVEVVYLHNARRRTDGNAIIGNISGDDAPTADNALLADGHSSHDHHTLAKPGAISDVNGTGLQGLIHIGRDGFGVG